jgi:Protein of unknown function (DUF3775)
LLKYLSKKDLQQIIRVSDACNKTREMLLENYSVPKVVMPENCSVSYVNVADLPRFDADNIHKIKLKKLLGDLSKDQRRALIAIMWIGRGDFAPDFSRAFEATKVISNQGDIQYLLGKGARRIRCLRRSNTHRRQHHSRGDDSGDLARTYLKIV